MDGNRINFPRIDGAPGVISLVKGVPTFIVGRNGTGKSALVQFAVAHLGSPVRYIPGARVSYLDHESLNLTPESRRGLDSTIMSQDRQQSNRFKPWGGGSRNERIIFDLQNAELQYKLDAAEKISQEGRESSAIAVLQARSSPLDRVNTILRQASLPIELVARNAELKAKRGDAIFSIARLSDGERAAVLLIAEVMTAPQNCAVVLDEPERHLHKSIVVPLLRAVLYERSDCLFLVSTHELELVSIAKSSEVIIVRGCTWTGENVSAWDVDSLSPSAPLPEDLKVDLYGSRRKLLFVEGEASSLDQPLYSLVFPDVSVNFKASCRDVERAVRGLAANEELHHTVAFGLVDGDGMSESVKEGLRAQRIFPLPLYSVEGIYFGQSVVESVAERQAELIGLDAKAALSSGIQAALDSISDLQKAIFCSMLAERRIREAVFEKIPNARQIAEGSEKLVIEVDSNYSEELDRLNSMIASGNVYAILERYPVRRSHMLDKIAKALRFASRYDYCRFVLSLLASRPDLVKKIQSNLNELTEALLDG